MIFFEHDLQQGIDFLNNEIPAKTDSEKAREKLIEKIKKMQEEKICLDTGELYRKEVRLKK
jgi:hypothetical protein